MNLFWLLREGKQEKVLRTTTLAKVLNSLKHILT